MTIKLVTEEQYQKLLDIQKKHKALTFQNKGYEYIDKSKLSKNDKIALKEVSDLLKEHIKGFVEFNNFIIRKDGAIAIRIQYNWSADNEDAKIYFVGVGYLFLTELLNGFVNNEK